MSSLCGRKIKAVNSQNKCYYFVLYPDFTILGLTSVVLLEGSVCFFKRNNTLV